MENRFLENNAPFLWNHWCYVSGRNGKMCRKYSDQLLSKHASSNLFNFFSTRNFQASIQAAIDGRQVEFWSKNIDQLLFNPVFVNHLMKFEALIARLMKEWISWESSSLSRASFMQPSFDRIKNYALKTTHIEWHMECDALPYILIR